MTSSGLALLNAGGTEPRTPGLFEVTHDETVKFEIEGTLLGMELMKHCRRVDVILVIIIP